MVTRTFLSKCTTIFNGSKDNFGLNPIGMLNYGRLISRCLLYFDIDNIKSAVNDGGFIKDKTKHILKLTNCGSIDKRTFDEMMVSSDDMGVKERACSFSIIAFKVPERWDAGNGFDNSTDFWLLGKASVSQHGANWFNAYDGKRWGTKFDESGELIAEDGVYSFEKLEKEYEKFKNGEDSVIICEQKFDVGNEDFELDITKYVNDVLDGKNNNYGICLAFSPEIEELQTEYTQYVGFFTNHTNTFFHPVVESRCSDVVRDNRYSFFNGKSNRLYFYANIDGIPTDLDELPTCEINGVYYDVFRQKTGVYYADVKLSASDNEICYDIWRGTFDGEEFEEELEFVVLPKKSRMSLGDTIARGLRVEPALSGINDWEKIYQGDERTISVKFNIQYTSNYELINECYYRLYVMDGERELDVIDWDDIDVTGFENSFKICSKELLPGSYYVDIKAKCGKDLRIFKDKLHFKVVSNVTEMTK